MAGILAFALAAALLLAAVLLVVVADLRGNAAGEAMGFLPYGVAFALLTGLWFLLARRQLVLHQTDGGLSLQLDGRELARSPFEIRWGYSALGDYSGILLLVGVIVDDVCVVTIREYTGSSPEPAGWLSGLPDLPTNLSTVRVRTFPRRFLVELVATIEAAPSRDGDSGLPDG